MQTQKALLEQIKADKGANMSRTERWMEWGAKNKYSIVAGSWAVSIAVAFAIVRRNR